MLPKTTGSAQTHKSMSFIWIVWSTLHIYLWPRAGHWIKWRQVHTTSQDYQITLSNFCTKENIPKETLAFSLSNLTFISLMSTRISSRHFFFLSSCLMFPVRFSVLRIQLDPKRLWLHDLIFSEEGRQAERQPVSHYTVHVLWCHPIKLIQVVSTSEFH